MPEIAEVARTVHFIRKNLVGKTIAKVLAPEDLNVFGKVGTSGPEFEKHMTGKKVVDAGQQGKYFWMIMSSPPHPVMHFGMSGWLKYKHEHSYYYRAKDEDEPEEWPPKYWKFQLETKEDPKIQAAFVDLRRFARIRLVDCKAAEIRNVSPLVENGPDPVIDKDIVTVDWLKEKCNSKKVPIKAMLLDQANISGIGNWVGDEIMYNAKMHPEQYANTLSDEEIKTLHKSIHYVCGTAVDLLADSEQFPEEWLFKHRWGKGKKDASKTLPNGEKIQFLTVGGRTSAVIPSIQKKSGAVAKEMDEAEIRGEEEEKPKAKGQKKKSTTTDEVTNGTHINGDSEESKPTPKKQDKKANGTASRKSKFKEELESAPNTPAPNQSKKRKSAATEEKSDVPAKKSAGKKAKVKEEAEETTGRRRSGRVSKA